MFHFIGKGIFRPGKAETDLVKMMHLLHIFQYAWHAIQTSRELSQAGMPVFMCK